MERKKAFHTAFKMAAFKKAAQGKNFSIIMT
jgi:hypothetical protein